MYNHSIITKAKLRKLCDAKLQGLLIWQPVTIIYYDNSFFYFLSKGSGNIRALQAKKSALKLKKWDYVNHPLAKEIVKVALDDYVPCSLPINEPYYIDDNGEVTWNSTSNEDEETVVSIDAPNFFRR